MFRFAPTQTGNRTHRGGGSRSRRGIPIVAVLTGSVVLAACGVGNGPSTQPGKTTTQVSGPVEKVESNVTAQMVAAAAHGSSTSHEATFVLTAFTASGLPAGNQPVAFWVGPMAPLSGIHPAHWYPAGQTSADPYVASYTTTTDAAGQARIVLLGQPAKSMEMVAAKVGDLDGYDTAAGHGLGLLDAWWTTPKTTPTAPVGDTVTVSPFMEAVRPGRSLAVHVQVADAAGKPIVGAGVEFIPETTTGGIPAGTSVSSISGMGSSGMGSSGTSMSSASGMGSSGTSTSGISGPLMPGAPGSLPVKTVTDGGGVATYRFHRPQRGSTFPLRIVVTQRASTARIAGGMSAEILSPS